MKFIKQSTVIVNGSKRENFKKRLFITVVFLIIDILMFVYMYRVHIANEEFARKATEFYRLNAQTVFSIDKIYMYSNAGGIDNKDTRAIWNLDLYQYTDIAIYINNRSDDKLSYENSVKSMCIDNIKFTKVKKGNTALYYKNINEFGKSVYDTGLETTSISMEMNNNTATTNPEQTENQNGLEENNQNAEQQISQNVQQAEVVDEATKRKQIIENIDNSKAEDKIEYSILNDGDLDYSKPQFYTDCSNPITIEYLNSKIKENEIISDINNDVVFDGNILRKSGVVLGDIACTLSFNITIINYYNQKYVATVYLDIPLEDTTTGDNIYKGKFVKKIENTNFVKFFRLE